MDVRSKAPPGPVGALAKAIDDGAGAAARFVVAIAGPPAAGKSTLAEALRSALPAGAAIVVPMDGFHFDDRVLAERGLASRKGAPETFDFAGLRVLLQRIRSGEADIAIPLFDRDMELSRAGAAVIGADVRFVLVEGNYLLLEEDPWRGLVPLFDLTIFVDVDRDELERRLVDRWRKHGRDAKAARAWIDGNDLPNIDRVLRNRRPADHEIKEP